jgi:CheY-like chemotaxis protein
MSLSGEVLIVDDVPDNLRVLGDILVSQGLRVRLAPGGAYAMTSVGVRKPDLILMDLSMPEMDGVEVCRRLRADPATAAIPVLFLSASQDPVERVACFAAGGCDFIPKPFNAAEVLARVSSQLTLARQRSEIEAANARLSRQVKEESTGRQDAELIAHDRQIRLDLALSATGMCSWAAASPDGHIVVSPEASALLGCDAMGLPGGWRELVDGFSAEDRPVLEAAWRSGLDSGSVFEAEGWWTGRNQRRRIRIRGRFTGGSRQGQRVVGLVWEVTAEHSLRQRLARSDKMEALGQLAGGLAHDFNNHLQVIVGNLDLLRQGAGLGHASDPRLAAIHRSVSLASELVRDLLAFARRREVEQTTMQLAKATFDVEVLLRCSLGSSCALVLGTIDEAALVVGNREQFQNALLNLCLNECARCHAARWQRPHRRLTRDDIRQPLPVLRARCRRRVRRHQRGRRWLRHTGQPAGSHLRAVLHHQAGWPRHRPRPGHGGRLRHRPPWPPPARLAAWPGRDLPHPPPPGRRTRAASPRPHHRSQLKRGGCRMTSGCCAASMAHGLPLPRRMHECCSGARSA